MKEKRRLLLIIDTLNSGGAQRQLVGLAKLLKDNGHTVRVISYIDAPFYKAFLDENEVDNECLIEGGPAKPNYIKVYRAIKKDIKCFKPEVVIAYLQFPSIMSSLIHSRDKSFKLIVSERNTTQEFDWFERIKFWTFRWADYIVPNSHSQERFIQLHYPKYASKIVTITNFVDTDIFVPATKQFENPTPILLSVGRVMVQKNVLVFINVLKRLKDEGILFKVLWYGGKEDQYFKECETKQKEYGLDGLLEFKGRTNDVLDVYQKADVFCLPSIYEGYPNVLCEAMCCGLPVTASDVCDNSDIVSSSCGRLFNPYDEDDMYNKIKEILTMNKSELAKMGECSRDISIRKFSKVEFVIKYESLF
ncbi:MAG: glycosyltransferase family 4 protein [Paludibacteraceae bacterium]|nr:glycosyltransferase family 4 protein [Paludibacteraceae bacterium]MBP5664516.1 glycosyltransferase family 4 protein [Bacteroidales bacterium]